MEKDVQTFMELENSHTYMGNTNMGGGETKEETNFFGFKLGRKYYRCS